VQLAVDRRDADGSESGRHVGQTGPPVTSCVVLVGNGLGIDVHDVGEAAEGVQLAVEAGDADV
jgi:hypothetical protein